MKYTEVKGNLLDMFDKGEVDQIAHGCNTYNLMNSGIAAQIKERYPEAFYADRFADMPTGMWRVGKLTHNEDRTIFNLYTQVKPGTNADLMYIRMALRLLNIYYLNDAEILGLPLVGCGIGGLTWEEVKPIYLEEITKPKELIVVHYDR